MSFQGEAILDQDYTVSFDSQGEETQILDIPQNENYGKMRSFPDGRLRLRMVVLLEYMIRLLKH